MRTFEKPALVLSACLDLQPVRYNGEIVRDEFVIKLRQHCQIIPVCPEVGIGLGVPRSKIHVYVENGVADLGIVGYDILLEKKPDVYKLYNLGIGFCKVVVVGLQENYERYTKCTYLRVASKYPNITKGFFLDKGIKTKIIYLSGSVELAPIIGLSDCIVDLVQTGRTLKENNLIIYEEIATSYAHLICNRASYRNKKDQILDVLSKVTESVF